MRAFGLLCLLGGCLLLLLPYLQPLLHLKFKFPESQTLGGLLLGIGVILIILTRRRP